MSRIHEPGRSWRAVVAATAIAATACSAGGEEVPLGPDAIRELEEARARAERLADGTDDEEDAIPMPLRLSVRTVDATHWEAVLPPSSRGAVVMGPRRGTMAGLRVVVPETTRGRRVTMAIDDAPPSRDGHRIAPPLQIDADPPFEGDVIVEVPFDVPVGRVVAVVDGRTVPAYDIGVTADGTARIPGVRGGRLELYEAPSRLVAPDRVVLDPLPASCAEAHARRPELPSGPFRLAYDGREDDLWCDMETEGGGWTLVYTYRLQGFGGADAEDNQVDVSPNPGWPDTYDLNEDVEVATSSPTSPERLGAVPFASWKALGDAWLLRSPMTHWLSCVPAGGDLTGWLQGPIDCHVVRYVADRCFDVVPNLVEPGYDGAGVTFDRDGSGAHGVYLEHSSRGWPNHDPCASNHSYHVHRLVQPRGTVWVRPTRTPVVPDAG